jgi:hypothetical protein
MSEQNAGCGCQYDAAGNVFVDHCVCPLAEPAPIDWPARLRRAATVRGVGMYPGGLLLALAKELEENPGTAKAIGQVLSGETP